MGFKFILGAGRSHGIVRKAVTIPEAMIVCRVRQNLQKHSKMLRKTWSGEKNRNKRRTMIMWKNALDNGWENRPIEATRKIIDQQPKIMRVIIELVGSRTLY